MALSDAFLLALWLSAGGYVAAVGAMAWRTAHGASRFPAAPPDADLPSVTVIVAARDEERDLPRCLAALTALDYPAGRLRLLVADDHSTDGTAEVVRRFERVAVGAGGHAPLTGRSPNGRSPDGQPPDGQPPAGRAAAPLGVEYLRVPEPEGHVRGKALALDAAIATTDAEVLLFTDADCAPPPDWARRLAEPFADPAVGLVFGLTVIDAGGRVADGAQALDWALLLAACGALTEAGVPATGMGNNMAVRSAAYHATGGYPALPFSVTEDFALFRAVVDGTDYAARFRLDPDTVVHTHPAATLRGAYEQRRRWARGGLGGGPLIWATYVALFLTHALPVAALAVAPLHALGVLGAMALADLALLGATRRRTGGALALRPAAFALGEALRFVYLLTLPVVLLARPRISWKGRAH